MIQIAARVLLKPLQRGAGKVEEALIVAAQSLGRQRLEGVAQLRLRPLKQGDLLGGQQAFLLQPGLKLGLRRLRVPQLGAENRQLPLPLDGIGPEVIVLAKREVSLRSQPPGLRLTDTAAAQQQHDARPKDETKNQRQHVKRERHQSSFHHKQGMVADREAN